MELYADDVAAFMQAIGVERAHVSGLSHGAAAGPLRRRNGIQASELVAFKTCAHASIYESAAEFSAKLELSEPPYGLVSRFRRTFDR